MATARWYTPRTLTGPVPLATVVPPAAPLALLRRQPWRFELAMAVRLLEQMADGCVPVGDGAFPGREAVRFQQDVRFETSGSEVIAVHAPQGGRPQSALVVRDGTFLGGSGVLPYVYAAWIRDLIRRGDEAPRAFLDLLQHRLTSVQVRAQRTMRPGLDGAGPDRIRMMVWALSALGLGLDRTRNRLAFPDALVVRQAPLFLGRARSAVGLERAVSDMLSLERPMADMRLGPLVTRLHPLQGGWHPLRRQDQTVLGDRWGSGGQNRALGTAKQAGTAVVGTRVYDPAAGVLLEIGPLSLEQFFCLLPLPRAGIQGEASPEEAGIGGQFRRLTDLVRLYLVDAFSVRVRLVLAPRQRPPLRLGSPLARLGWSSWLTGARLAHQPEDRQVVLTLPQVWSQEETA